MATKHLSNVLLVPIARRQALRQRQRLLLPCHKDRGHRITVATAIMTSLLKRNHRKIPTVRERTASNNSANTTQRITRMSTPRIKVRHRSKDLLKRCHLSNLRFISRCRPSSHRSSRSSNSCLTSKLLLQ